MICSSAQWKGPAQQSKYCFILSEDGYTASLKNILYLFIYMLGSVQTKYSHN